MTLRKGITLTIATLAIIVFDLFMTFLDKLLWGEQYADIIVESPWSLIFVHLLVTSIVWFLGGFLVLSAIRKSDANIVDLRVLQGWRTYLIAFIFATVFMVMEMVYYNETVPQFIREFRVFEHYYQDKGIIIVAVQNVYYLAESFLVVLLLSLAHYCFENLFKSKNIPYAGIFLGMTWGLVHFIKGPVIGLVISIGAVLIGYIYIKMGRLLYPGVLFVWLIFLL